MKSKLISSSGTKTWAIIFDTGDEVASGLLQFARQNSLSASHFSAIGAFEEAVLGFFDIEAKDYKRIELREQVEVLSLVGDIALEKDEPKIHAHVVLGTADGSAKGGHLIQARVRPTLEVILTESPEHLVREFDKTTGLALIRV